MIHLTASISRRDEVFGRDTVALLINEGQEVEEAVNRAGYLFFTEVDAFHAYVLKEILANSALDSLFS